MKEFTAGNDYKVLGASECIDTETVKGSEWHVRMINLRFSLEMLNEWFDTDVINDALCYATQEEYWRYRDEKNRLRSEFEAALKKSLDIPEDNSFALSQSVAEFFHSRYDAQKEVKI